MSPRALHYKPDTIIYFHGDHPDSVFILQNGKVSLNYSDIETGQEVRDLIQTGEFFGVKSALGRYPREENAVVLQSSQVVKFTVAEFEQMALKNTRIIMKMLKVFSNQLRRIHKQVQHLLYAGESMSQDEGLFSIGSYFLKKGRYEQALYAFQRYLTYFPNGRFADKAESNIKSAEMYAKGATPPKKKQTSTEEGQSLKPESKGKELSGTAKKYYDAVSLFSNESYEEAMKVFKEIISEDAEGEYAVKAEYEVGRCLFSLGKYDDCINQYQELIRKYPKHPELNNILLIVGRSYDEKGNKGKAEGFYNKILSIAPENDPVYRKAKKALREH